MPSGRLWMVTASASIIVRESFDFGPSAVCAPMCRCGVNSSINSRNAIPAKNPTAAGITPLSPADSSPSRGAAISIDGISSDHTLAATITPLANPNSVFCILSGISFFMKKTKAEPSIVPISGSSIPMITAFISLIFHAAKMHISHQMGIPRSGYFREE